MNNFFKFLLESSACISLFYAVYWAFLKNETFFKLNRFYLVSSMLLSFSLPLLDIPSPFRTHELMERTEGFIYPSGIPMRSLGAVDILVGVYILVSLMLFTRYAHQFYRLFKTIKEHGIQEHQGHRFVFISQDTQPFSFFKLIFLNKSSITRQGFERIISHEMVHIRQYHSLDIVMMELVTIFQWFNPFVWPYKKSLKETHEYLADDGVIAQGCNAVKYQLLILEQQMGGKLFEFANNFHHSQIKRRLTMMTKIKSKGWAKLKLLLILPLALLLVLAFAEPQPVSSGTPSDDDVGVAHYTGPAVDAAQPQEHEKSEDEKKKALEEKKKQESLKKLKMITEKMKALEMELKETEDVEKKKELKMKLAELKKAKENLKHDQGKQKFMDEEEKKAFMKKELKLKMKELSQKLEETKDPEKQEQIRAHLKELEKKYQALEAEAKAEKEKK